LSGRDLDSGFGFGFGFGFVIVARPSSGGAGNVERMRGQGDPRRVVRA
jgi:hypothetical protein